MEEFLFIQNDVLPALVRGLWVSLSLIVPSATLGLGIGIAAGALRVYGSGAAAALTNLYVALFRGVPLVVQLFVWYFGLPHLGIYMTSFVASVVGFSLCSGAYHSEYIRGALLSIKKGQTQAAKALGFSQWQTVVFVILPQALRRALPGCGNEIIYLIKYSSLAYMVTCIELTGEGKILASRTFKYTEVFLLVAAFYLALVSIASWLLHRVEKRVTVPGFETREA
jgi:polar amino acid transport system permease protein